MAGLKDILLDALAITVGALFYVGLNWVPVLGPLFSGALVGYLRGGNTKKGFHMGVSSGVIGFVVLLLIFSGVGVFQTTGLTTVVTILIVWILFIWNMTGIFFCGVGGVFGSIASRMSLLLGGMPKIRETQEPKPTHRGGITYVICPNCGEGNPKSEGKCSSCGIRLGAK